MTKRFLLYVSVRDILWLASSDVTMGSGQPRDGQCRSARRRRLIDSKREVRIGFLTSPGWLLRPFLADMRFFFDQKSKRKMPGRHVTDQQVRNFMSNAKNARR